jgi:hypothetical protein
MNDLKIIDYYNQVNEDKVLKFNRKINSNLKVVTDYESVDYDFEWLSKMEDCIRYLDNILRNPNRFIVNEEDIVKIELARRVTVESIKHLSRNTNLIQDYDKKTGDVKPSKILNINKEESFNTYENRFIYSLIQNMKSFISRKKTEYNIEGSSLKDNKSFVYSGNTKVGNEIVDVHMELNSKLSDSDNKNNGNDIVSRIEKLELQISDLTSSEVYKNLAKLHVALVTSPIKKTNVILKNVNFQYALDLWNYMQSHIDSSLKRDKNSKNYFDSGDLKECMDESFMLNYLVMDSLSNNKDEVSKKEVSEKIVGNMIQQVVALNGNISEDELKEIVGRQFTIVKYKSVTSDREIQKIFRDNISKYLDIVNNLKI